MLDVEGLTGNKMIFQCFMFGTNRLKKTTSLVTYGGYFSLRRSQRHRECVCLQPLLHKNVLFSVMSSSFIHIVAHDRIFFFFEGWIIFHCMYLPHFLCLVVCQWTGRSLPHFGYCEYCCSASGSESSFTRSCVQFFEIKYFKWGFWRGKQHRRLMNRFWNDFNFRFL